MLFTVQPPGLYLLLCSPHLSSSQPLQFFLTVTDFNWVRTRGVYSTVRGPSSHRSAAAEPVIITSLLCISASTSSLSLLNPFSCSCIFVNFPSLIFSPFWPHVATNCFFSYLLFLHLLFLVLHTLSFTSYLISSEGLLAFQPSMEK